MSMTTHSAIDELAALEERVRDGDAQVTPTALGKARDAAALETLRLEAEANDRSRVAADEFEARRAEFLETTLPAALEHWAEMCDAYETLVEAGRVLRTGLEGANKQMRGVVKTAQALGLEDAVPSRLARGMTFPSAWDRAAVDVRTLSTRRRSGQAPRARRHALRSDESIEREDERLAVQWDGSDRQRSEAEQAAAWVERTEREAALHALRCEVAAEFGLPLSRLVGRDREELVFSAEAILDGKRGTRSSVRGR